MDLPEPEAPIKAVILFWELHIAVKKGLLIAVENLQIIRRHRNFGFFLIEPHDIGIF